MTIVLALRDPIPVEFVREFQLSTISQPVPDDFLSEVIRESLRLPARVWHPLIEGIVSMPFPAGLSSLTMPVLLMRGEEDAVFPRTELEALETLVPRAKVLEYEGVGHAPHWESPERFARDLEAFLRK